MYPSNHWSMNDSAIDSLRGSSRPLLWLLGVVGFGLVGIGVYFNRSLAGRPRCDGCEPWHPLFVLAPIVLGSGLLAVSWLGTRRFGTTSTE